MQENGYNVVFNLNRPEGGRSTGTAEYYTGSDFRLVRGKAVARTEGADSFEIKVYWDGGKRGYYVGVINAQGAMHGITKEHPLDRNSDVVWTSRQRLPCLAQADASTPTLKRIGKRPLDQQPTPAERNLRRNGMIEGLPITRQNLTLPERGREGRLAR